MGMSDKQYDGFLLDNIEDWDDVIELMEAKEYDPHPCTVFLTIKQISIPDLMVSAIMKDVSLATWDLFP